MIDFKLKDLYSTIGVSKQSVHQAKTRQQCFDDELAELVILVDQLRREHPGCGVEKMYYTLKPKFMGRDTFCDIFINLGYRVKPINNYQRTTYSGSFAFSNLIEGMAVIRPYQVIQSDITYFDLSGEHYYLVFIIDVYTRIVLGYQVSDHLRAEANVKALKMALKVMQFKPQGLIHHSDRGAQYGSKVYTRLLDNQGIHISMGMVAWENPYAERINGIIKNEYLKKWEIKDFNDLKRNVAKAVNHYNDKRLHRAFKMKHTPTGFLKNLVNLPAQERPTVIVYTEGKLISKGASSASVDCPREEPQAHICPMEINQC